MRFFGFFVYAKATCLPLNFTGKALYRPIIKQIHVQHIEKRIQDPFQFMKLTKINGTMGTHTLENSSKAQPTHYYFKINFK
jgi:hypothetical protein